MVILFWISDVLVGWLSRVLPELQTKQGLSGVVGHVVAVVLGFAFQNLEKIIPAFLRKAKGTNKSLKKKQN